MNRDQSNPNESRNGRGRRQGREQTPMQGPGMGGQPMMPPPGFPPRPGMGGQPPTPPPGFVPPGPGMEAPPRMAPPNFIPEAPGVERRSTRGPGFEFGVVPGRQIGPRDLRRCINNFTFIWLVNGSSFWYFPTFIDRQFAYGFRWRRNSWEYERINLNRIIFFRCF